VARVPPGRAAAWESLTGWHAGRRKVGAALAAKLGAPAAAELPMIVLMPPSGLGGLLVIEAEGSVVPLRSLGWAAAELSVAGLDDIVARAVPLGFSVIGPPRTLGSTATIAACQIVDPGGACLYGSDVRAYAGKARIPKATQTIDRMFIAVLASGDLEATRAWYAGHFGVPPISDHAVPIPVLTAAWNSPPDTRWRISSQQLNGDGLVEIDQYPPGTPQRPRDALGLAGGIAAVGFISDREDVLVGTSDERLILVRDAAVP
jgi:hypothetical protein